MTAAPVAIDSCVSETTTTGTGTLTLGNTPDAAYISLADAYAQGLIADGDTVDYRIDIGSLGSPTAWEEGNGTVGSSGTTLTRTPTLTYDGSVYDGTSPSALSLAAGTKYVTVVWSAATINTRVRSQDHGTKSSGTLTCEPSVGDFQTVTNAGAFTLAPPTETGWLILTITNDSAAGTITTSGFDDVYGDSLDTTLGNHFECLIMNTGSRTSLQVTAATDNV